MGSNRQPLLCSSLHWRFVSLLSFLDSSFFPIAGRYILLNVFLAIAVDNLSNPETLVEAQKLNDDQRPESKRESESEGEMRNDVDDGVDGEDHVDNVDGPNYTLCAVKVDDVRFDCGSEEEYCQQKLEEEYYQQKETESAQKMALTSRTLSSQRSLFFFSPENKFRRACYKICNNAHFGDIS